MFHLALLWEIMVDRPDIDLGEESKQHHGAGDEHRQETVSWIKIHKICRCPLMVEDRMVKLGVHKHNDIDSSKVCSS